MDHGRKIAFFANHGTEKCPIYESRHNANSRITVKKIRIHSTKKEADSRFHGNLWGVGARKSLPVTMPMVLKIVPINQNLLSHEDRYLDGL